jgi:hypothetical protein
MLAPIATLVFLVALWSLAMILLEILGEDSGKIAQALAGRSRRAQPPALLPVSVRYLPRAGSVRRPATALAPRRAAA